ncbi:MAG: DUF523 domain-containing protein, partial [Planctomycetes bacterium]|nr:DUF523 domain-containing protein [Planctomycetota bacterium]
MTRKLAHDAELRTGLRVPTPDDPWRLLVSGCLLGQGCGIDGTDYGMGGCLGDLLASDRLVVVSFCPEDATLGTPRSMPDIHGGDGFDVLDGHARVMDELGNDLTEPMIEGGRRMLAFALENRVDLAILTDMS